MALERLDGYEPLVGRWEADQHAAEIRNPANRYFVAREDNEIMSRKTFIVRRDAADGSLMETPKESEQDVFELQDNNSGGGD